MKSLLVKIFIPNYKNHKDPSVRRSYGKLASIFGIITNLFISAIKIVVGALFGFISFIADGLNNLSDGISSIVSYIGFKMSSKPADKDHPYGHARMEYLSGIIVATMVVALGVELLFRSIEEIFSSSSFTISYEQFLIASILLSVTILIKIYQCYFYKTIGKRIDSLSLKASSFDSFCDVLASSSVLIGLIISYYLKVSLDAYLGVAIAIFIFISGLKLLIEESSPLLGKKPKDETINALLDLVKEKDAVLSMHDLNVHNYGEDKIYASLHICMDSTLSLIEAHDIVDEIERECLEKLNIILVLHVDPVIQNNKEIKDIKTYIQSLLHTFDIPISFHDFHTKETSDHTDIYFDLVVPSNNKYKEKEIASFLENKIKEKSPSYHLHITMENSMMDLMYGRKDEE